MNYFYKKHMKRYGGVGLAMLLFIIACFSYVNISHAENFIYYQSTPANADRNNVEENILLEEDIILEDYNILQSPIDAKQYLEEIALKNPPYDILIRCVDGENKKLLDANSIEEIFQGMENTSIENIDVENEMVLDFIQEDGESYNEEIEENIIKEQLEQEVRISQEDLVLFLEEGVRRGEIHSYESFYIVNSIHAIVNTKEALKEIAKRVDVSYITLNQEIAPIETVQESTRRRRSIESSSLYAIDWPVNMIHADRVWEEYGIYGEGVVVGIIDTGVNYKLPSLKKSFKGYDAASDRFIPGYYKDFFEDKEEPEDSYVNNHGTHIAGIICGDFLESKIGIAPKVKFISARAVGPDGTSIVKIIRSSEWMLEKRPDVINCSWGYHNDNNIWFSQIAQAWRDAGIVAVFAAGNTQNIQTLAAPGSITNPGNLPNVIAVGAVDSEKRLAKFSKRGPSAFDRGENYPKPDFVAPGVSIRSSTAMGSLIRKSGTSYAAPYVTATVALMRSANPNITVSEIEEVLKSTTEPRTDAQYLMSPNMGYGYGLINTYLAVKKVREMVQDNLGIEPTLQNSTAIPTIAIPSYDQNLEEDLEIPSTSDIESISSTPTSTTRRSLETTKASVETSVPKIVIPESSIRGRASGGGSSGGSGGGSRRSAISNKDIKLNISSVGSAENWRKDSKGWWYQNENGSYEKSSWKWIQSKWYYFDANGYATTGWQNIKGKWYYMNADCAMQRGWILVKEKWYYLGEDGAMYVNQITPDGYKVDANGVWIK